MRFSEKINEKIIPLVMKFLNMKGIVALKDGIMFIMPLTIIGSIYILLSQLPIPAFNTYMASMFGKDWSLPLAQVNGATFKIMAIVAVMGITYAYVKNEGHEPFAASIMSLVCFLTINPSSVLDSKSGVTISNVISKTWTSGQGMISAIIVGLFVGAVYSWFLNRDIRIKMPEGVPQGVANVFTSLIPGFVVIFCAFLVFTLFKVSMNTTFIEWIYIILQVPLQGMSDSFGAAVIIAILFSFLWWFGIHGTTLVHGVVTALLTANAMANQELLIQSGNLTIGNGAHIVTEQFLSFLTIGGTGLTLGLVIAMAFVSKSTQFKSLGKLALVPAFFNINEPILFGFPMVMNPIMFIPFIAAPASAAIIEYLCISTGLVQPFSMVMVPWTTPPIISGFILGGWKMAVMQVFIVIVATAIYFPFFKKQDAMNLKNEEEAMDSMELTLESIEV
jgi:PTS system, lactose/cellobiose family IIC component